MPGITGGTLISPEKSAFSAVKLKEHPEQKPNKITNRTINIFFIYGHIRGLFKDCNTIYLHFSIKYYKKKKTTRAKREEKRAKRERKAKKKERKTQAVFLEQPP